MRNFFYSALIGLLISSQAFAGLPPTTAKGQSDTSPTVTFNLQAPNSQMTRINATTALIETGNHNLLVNPGFEAGTAGWATSAGSISALSSAGHLDQGKFFLSWSPSATNDVLSSGYISITSGTGISGANGVVSCRFKDMGPGSTASLQAYDGTNILATTAVTAPSNGYSRTSVNFVFPTSGNVRLQVTSNNAGVFNVDDCYLGLAEGFNLSQVSQARVYGTLTYAAAANCSWLANATTYADAAADTDCSTPVATGSVTAPATKVMQGVLNNAPPGIFDVSVQFRVDQSVSAVGACRIVDDLGNQFGQDEFITGTAVAIPLSLSGTYTYTTGGNRTLKVQCKATSGSVNLVAITGDFIMTVRYSPSSTQQVYGPDATAASWTGYFTGCNWSSTGITAFADTTTSACTLNTRLNTNLGTVTQESGNHSGITFTPTKAGKVKTCVRGVAYNSTVSGAQGIRLTDGTNVADTTQLNLLTTTQPFSLCLDSKVASIAPMTVKIQTSNTAANTENIGANGNLEWEVYQLDAGQPAPLTNGSVTSNSSGLERVERATIGCTGTSSITSQSGSWISTVGNNSSGACSITVAAGIFSGTPTCTVTSGSGASPGTSITTTSSTSLSVFGYNTQGGAALASWQAQLICMGPR
jgi:hypothetical protein